MADALQLETTADRLLLEDGSGVLVLETGRRFYISRLTPAVSPAFGALWDLTANALYFQLNEVRQNTALQSETELNFAETDASPVDYAHMSLVTAVFAAAEDISGTFSLVISCATSYSAADLSVQCMVRSVDGTTGADVATLYGGHAEAMNATVGALGEEVAVTTRQTRVMADVPVTATTVQAGQRLVVELGFRHHNTSTTSLAGYFNRGDPTATADWDLTSGLTGSLVPWIQFSSIDPATGGTVYDETARTITVAATVSRTDAVTAAELARAVSAAATVTGTDGYGYTETARSITIAATVAASDARKYLEPARSVAVAATVTRADVLKAGELARTVTIAATVTRSDALKAGELARAVSVAATVTATDAVRIIIFETNRTITIAATVTRTDTLKRGELARSVAVAATTAAADAARLGEPARTITITAAVTTVDGRRYTDLDRLVTLVVTVTAAAASRYTDTAAISVAATVSRTDAVTAAETARTITVAVTVAAVDFVDVPAAPAPIVIRHAEHARVAYRTGVTRERRQVARTVYRESAARHQEFA